MSLTDLNEINVLQEWAESHEKCFAFEKQQNDSSYFQDRISEDTYMMQYGFRSIGDLYELFNHVTNGRMDGKIAKVLSVAAFKCKPADNAAAGRNEERQFEIPEFIYNF